MIPVSEQIPIYRFVSAILSMIGSATIIFILLRSRKKLSSAYRRIIFGLSISDILQSINFIFSFAAQSLISREDATICNIQAFLLNYGATSAPMYNFMLCLFYVFTLYHHKEEMSRRVEIFFHLFNFLWSSGTSTFLLVVKAFSYREDIKFCWIFDKPINCSFNPDIECERSNNVKLYFLAFQGYTAVIFIFIVISMILICTKVIGQERRMKRRFAAFESTPPNNDITKKNNKTDTASVINQNEATTQNDDVQSVASALKTSTRTSTLSTPHVKSKRPVVYQSLFYALAFFLPWFFPFLFMNLSNAGIHSNVLWIFSGIFVSLQGLLNFLVFIRPRVLFLKKSHPEYSWWKAFLETVKSASKSTSSTVAIPHGKRRLSRLRFRASKRNVKLPIV